MTAMDLNSGLAAIDTPHVVYIVLKQGLISFFTNTCGVIKMSELGLGLAKSTCCFFSPKTRSYSVIQVGFELTEICLCLSRAGIKSVCHLHARYLLFFVEDWSSVPSAYSGWFTIACNSGSREMRLPLLASNTMLMYINPHTDTYTQIQKC